jgi:hypothetical protein
MGFCYSSTRKKPPELIDYLVFSSSSPSPEPELNDRYICYDHTSSSQEDEENIPDDKIYSHLGYDIGDIIVINTPEKKYNLVVENLYKSYMVLKAGTLTYYLTYDHPYEKILAFPEDPFPSNYQRWIKSKINHIIN